MNQKLPAPNTAPTSSSNNPTTSEPESYDSMSPRDLEVEISKYRVGIPAPLPPPSFRHVSWDKPSEDLYDRFEPNFVTRAREITKKYGVDYDYVDIEFGFWLRPGPQRVPTLLITADPADWLPECAEVWTRIVREVKEHIDSELLRSGLLDSFEVVVEIVDERIFDPKHVGPILDNPQLELEWPAIQEKVFSMLESFEATNGAMNAISLFRYGTSLESKWNPITVFISVDPHVPPAAYLEVVADIQTYLDTLPYELTAHMERNSIDFCTFELPPPDSLGSPSFEYRDLVHLGDEIGPSVYLFGEDGKKRSPGFGTLGCYVEVKTKSTPVWTRYGLTNYHVMRPAFNGFSIEIIMKEDGSLEARPGAPSLGSRCWDTDRNGFAPSQPPPHHHTIEAPPRRTHDFIVWHSEETLKRRRKSNGPDTLQKHLDHQQEDQLELDRHLAFFDQGKHTMGPLLAVSGLARRSVGNQRLDWALLSVQESRQGTNALPLFWTYRLRKMSRGYRPLVPGYGSLVASSNNQSLRNLKSGDKIFKYGARTGLTPGFYHNFKTKCRLQHDQHAGMDMKPSDEYVFIPTEVGYERVMDEYWNTDPMFSKDGDSGAVVYDESGNVLGLLYTGQTPKEAGSRGYAIITPIEDILADIKAVSNGVITDIRVSPCRKLLDKLEAEIELEAKKEI